MAFKTKVLDEFAHKGLKILDTFNSYLVMYDTVPNGGLKDPTARKTLMRSISALAQAVQDLRVLGECEEARPEKQKEFDWKDLAAQKMAEVSADARESPLQVKDGEYSGYGHIDLLDSALGNLKWFAAKFAASSPAQVTLFSYEKDGCPWINFMWDFGNTLEVTPEFAKFDEFYYMNPKKGLVLTESTGLVLLTVKQIAEMHGGTLTSKITGQGLKIEFACPRDQRSRRK